MTGPRPKSKMTRVPTPPGRRTADRPTACRERTTCSAGAPAGADGGSYPRTLRAGPRRRAPPCAPTGRARRPSGCAPARPGRMPTRCARTRWAGPSSGRTSCGGRCGGCSSAGRPPKRFHDLRSSAGSVLLAQGVPLQEVWGLLGHSGIQITKDVYGHLRRERRRAVAAQMGAVLWGR